MITERKNYQLFGKILIEKLVITSPFRIPGPMPDEACFLYVIEGEIKYQLDRRQVNIPAKDAVLLKCGNYFGQMINTKSSKKQEIIIVHFHPEILKKVYDKELPKILQQPKIIDATINLQKINNEILIQKYIEGLLFYFDNPSLVDEEILVLNLKKLSYCLPKPETFRLFSKFFRNFFLR